MNFFFGLNNDIFQSQITIPKFQNRFIDTDNDIKLFKCCPKNNEWKIEEISQDLFLKNFYRLNRADIKNEDIFFLAKKKDLKNRDKFKLENYNDFTDTTPDYRANFEIYFQDKNKLGFSSYQSEYPFRMIKIKNSIFSSVSSLANKKAERNYILVRNIFIKPIHQIFNAYLVDIKQKNILQKFELKTNYSNLLEIKNEHIKNNVYFITDKFLGIPIYISESRGHLSMEHTHPPHTYILSSNRYERVKKIRNKIYEIIN